MTQPPVPHRLSSILFLALLAGLAPAAWAQQDPAPEPVVQEFVAPQSAAQSTEPSVPPLTPQSAPLSGSDGVLSIASVTARIDELQTASLDEARRELLLGLWRETLAQLRSEESWIAQRAAFRNATEAAPADLERVQLDLAALPVPDAPPALPSVAGLSAAELDSLEAQAKADGARSDAEVTRLRDERGFRSERQKVIPGAMATVRQALDLVVPPSDVENSLEAEARLTQTKAKRRALQAELNCLEAERESYDARRELRTIKEDVARRQLGLNQALATKLHELTDAARLAERARDARDAKAAVTDARTRHPLLAEVAGRVAELSQALLSLESQQNSDDDRLTELRAESARLADEREKVMSKVETLGFSNAIGLILRRNRKALPDPRSFRGDTDRSAVEQAQELLLSLEDERNDLTDLDRFVARRMEGVDLGTEFDDPAALAAELRAAAAIYRSKLDDILADASDRVEQLAELAQQHTQLQVLVRDYQRSIDELILWVPDVRPISLSDLTALPRGLLELLSPRELLDLGQAVSEDVHRRAWLDGLVALALLSVMAGRRKIRQRMELLADQARKGTGHLMASVLALLLTLLRASILPAFLWLLGQRLSEVAEMAVLGESLRSLGRSLLPLTLLVALCRQEGLAPRHFRWPVAACDTLRRQSRRLAASLVPVMIPVLLVAGRDDLGLGGSVGRVFWLVLVFLLGVYFHRVLRTDGPVDQVLTAGGRTGQGPRLRAWAHVGSLLLVGSLAVLVLLGYLYASQVLLSAWGASAQLALALVIARSMGMLALANQARRLRYEQRRRTREAAGQETAGVLIEEDAGIDVAQVSAQARQLMRAGISVLLLVGLAAIWSDVLPALSQLDDVSIWESSFETEVVPEGGGTAVTQLITHSVSLADLLGALIVFALTTVCVRNVPGLLDIALLSRLTLEPGTGYAVKTITRYVLLFSGTALLAGRLGVTWQSMQWLVAAMGVGLGFGLQEVFANFICGLILLFERPVRVGDIVTVGGVEGTVTRIQMRATTVRDWNRKELLVPNRKFVTEEVTNWTLSDPITRLTFPVGVAYGSDTALTTKLLLQVSDTHPQVLKSPKATVVFRNFGDSTLEFHLRLFIDNFDNWPEVTHSVNIAIDDAFREHGVEIAFPQRDLHIKVKELGALAGAQGRAANAT